MTEPGVSIILCCHNGEKRLAETVRHIALQQVPDFLSWEFILIDNASTDHSVLVVEETWNMYNNSGKLRIVAEHNLGLSFARARGFEEAKYEYVIMCDDDNWLSRDYVALSYMIMWQNKSIGALGGLGTLKYEVQPESYFDQVKIFAAGEQWQSSGQVLSCRIYGAGCVIRKSAYLKLKSVGFKSLLTDRKGVALSSGGDHELCYALSIVGYDIWYDDRLRFTHFITKERLTWTYFIRYAKESTGCFDVLTSYKMIALKIGSHQNAFLALSRDFFYCLRRFVEVWISRKVFRSRAVDEKALIFKYIILQNKLKSYFNNFAMMARNHRQILEFQKSSTAKLERKRSALEQAVITFSASKPSQQH